MFFDRSLILAYDHGGKLEALADTLAVDLVWQVRESNIASKLLANNRDSVGSSVGHSYDEERGKPIQM